MSLSEASDAARREEERFRLRFPFVLEPAAEGSRRSAADRSVAEASSATWHQPALASSSSGRRERIASAAHVTSSSLNASPASAAVRALAASARVAARRVFASSRASFFSRAALLDPNMLPRRPPASNTPASSAALVAARSFASARSAASRLWSRSSATCAPMISPSGVITTIASGCARISAWHRNARESAATRTSGRDASPSLERSTSARIAGRGRLTGIVGSAAATASAAAALERGDVASPAGRSGRRRRSVSAANAEAASPEGAFLSPGAACFDPAPRSSSSAWSTSVHQIFFEETQPLRGSSRSSSFAGGSASHARMSIAVPSEAQSSGRDARGSEPESAKSATPAANAARSGAASSRGTPAASDAWPSSPNARGERPSPIVIGAASASARVRRRSVSPTASAAASPSRCVFSSSSTSAFAPGSGSDVRAASRRRRSADVWGGSRRRPSGVPFRSSDPGPVEPSSSSLGPPRSSPAHAAAHTAPIPTHRAESGRDAALFATSLARTNRVSVASRRSAARSEHRSERGSSPPAAVAGPAASSGEHPTLGAARSYAPKSSHSRACSARHRARLGWHASSAGPTSSATALNAAASTRGGGVRSPSAPVTTPRTRFQYAAAHFAPSPKAPVASAPSPSTRARASSAAARESVAPTAAMAAARASVSAPDAPSPATRRSSRARSSHSTRAASRGGARARTRSESSVANALPPERWNPPSWPPFTPPPSSRAETASRRHSSSVASSSAANEPTSRSKAAARRACAREAGSFAPRAPRRRQPHSAGTRTSARRRWERVARSVARSTASLRSLAFCSIFRVGDLGPSFVATGGAPALAISDASCAVLIPATSGSAAAAGGMAL